MSEAGIVRFLACGSVDDGKSTLIGHLLSLTGNIPDDQRMALERESGGRQQTEDGIDYSLLLDGLSAEREQGITIDVAYRYFYAEGRKFIVADTPGHEQYTRNMATGASLCSAALILIDAAAGVTPQTRRHALICTLMGIEDVLFAINKMDRVGWSEERFKELRSACAEVIKELGAFGGAAMRWHALPVSALHGDNLTAPSLRMPWFHEEQTVLHWLMGLRAELEASQAPLRLPVQYVLKGRCGDDHIWQVKERQASVGGDAVYRAYCGTVAAGQLRQGEQVVVLPKGELVTVRELHVGTAAVSSVAAGMAVSVVFEGDHDIARGDCIVALTNRPECSTQFKAYLVWMDEQPLLSGRTYLYRSPCGSSLAEVAKIRNVIGLESMQRLAADQLKRNDIGEVEISLTQSLPYEPYSVNRALGGFILIDRATNQTAACGMIQHGMRRAVNVHRHGEEVSRRERALLKGQQPKLIWLTGLSGSGKSTIANCLERKLHTLGRHTMLLDGDNVRHGLNRNLGFTEADRIENIRRIGEAAKLMLDAGLIVIAAFISPYRADRDKLRQLLGDGEFLEIFVDTPLDVCETRDPKGLYHQARAGQIPNFTGVSAPYEPPKLPELILSTTSKTAEQCAEEIVRLLQL